MSSKPLRLRSLPQPIPEEWTSGKWMEDTSIDSSLALDNDLEYYYRYPTVDKDWYVTDVITTNHVIMFTSRYIYNTNIYVILLYM